MTRVRIGMSKRASFCGTSQHYGANSHCENSSSEGNLQRASQLCKLFGARLLDEFLSSQSLKSVDTSQNKLLSFLSALVFSEPCPPGSVVQALSFSAYSPGLSGSSYCPAFRQQVSDSRFNFLPFSSPWWTALRSGNLGRSVR